MATLRRRFWHEEAGSMAIEWALIATILMLGAITGAVASRQSDLPEADDPPARLAR